MGENPELLQVHGWRLGRYRALVFALSGALVAVPACLIMVDVGMDVHAGMSYLLIAAVAVLAGGVARVEGWVMGGFVLAVMQSLVVWKFSAKWMDLVAFVLLLAVLLFRREGLLGIRKRTEES
jgi:branched-chain amino acid transport system permease protein